MKCLLIFDQLNDLLYMKCDKKFRKHAIKIGKSQGLITEDENDENDEESDPPEIHSSIVIQIFSPIITSHRLMTCQFGNSYSNIQCEDGTNLTFSEYMGYLFIYIGNDTVEVLVRTLGICTAIVKHLCGPNVPLLKTSKPRSDLLSLLMDTWQELQNSDQAVLVEAVEQLMVNDDLSSTTLNALQEAVDKLQQQSEYSKIHALVLVENKFLSLYSSRNAQDLIPADIIFLGILAESLHLYPKESTVRSGSVSDESDSELSEAILDLSPPPPRIFSPEAGQSGMRTFSPEPGQSGMRTFSPEPGPSGIELEKVSDDLNSYLILLAGNNPHAVHIGNLDDGVYVLLLFECGNNLVSTGLNDAFHALNALQNMQMQKDIDGVRYAFDFLDSGMKKVFDGLKKMKSLRSADVYQKNLQPKWKFIRKKYVEFLKNPDPECMMRIESSTSSFVDSLKMLFEITCQDESLLADHKEVIESVYQGVRHRLRDFSEFLRVKALRNFTLALRACLTINKYLEEFPGLVHFLYIDRQHHRLTAPSLDFNSEDTAQLTKKKIWSMVHFARSHLQEGHLSFMWKDTTFSYAYFLWFEDSAGSPLKPKIYPSSAMKNFPPPGIILEDFYKRLIETCFPKMSPSKIQCYELFCIHLGLATSSCVLEQSRRLAATIWEVIGAPDNPIDFL